MFSKKIKGIFILIGILLVVLIFFFVKTKVTGKVILTQLKNNSNEEINLSGINNASASLNNSANNSSSKFNLLKNFSKSSGGGGGNSGGGSGNSEIPTNDETNDSETDLCKNITCGSLKCFEGICINKHFNLNYSSNLWADFYGNVLINGTNASIGDEVGAFSNSSLCGSFIVKQEGIFGFFNEFRC